MREVSVLNAELFVVSERGVELPFAVEACQPGIRQPVDVVVDGRRAVIAVPVPVHGAAEQVVPVLVAVDHMLFRVYCFLKLVLPLVEPELGGERLQLTAYSRVVLGEILVEIHQLAVGVREERLFRHKLEEHRPAAEERLVVCFE